MTPGVEAVAEPEAIGRLADAALNRVNRFLRSGNASARSTRHRKNLLLRGLLIEAGMEQKRSEVSITDVPWHCVDETVASTFTETVVTARRCGQRPGLRSATLRTQRRVSRQPLAFDALPVQQRGTPNVLEKDNLEAA